MNKPRILIGSPIRRRPQILKAFLDGFKHLDYSGLDVHYCFIDDNDEAAASKMLRGFAKKTKNTEIIASSSILSKSNSKFAAGQNNLHGWNDELINRVATIKNTIIKKAKAGNYDYLFFIDSDMVLQPNTLRHLISKNVDIVSEIFWTDWHKDGVATPSVWMQDENTIVPKSDMANQDRCFPNREISSFYSMLKVPGIYAVGGLGALTLISKKSINSGVNFTPIDNISFYGEDRHFCIRAKALGLKLFVDTAYPAYHIYHDSLLKNVEKFHKYGYRESDILQKPQSAGITGKTLKKLKNIPPATFAKIKKSIKNFNGYYNYFRRKIFLKKRIVKTPPKLTLMMMVQNEENRYLEELLNTIKSCLDYAVILDDASTDNTIALCKKCLKDVPHKIIKNQTSGFASEAKNRKRLWQETIKTNPDWILALDADEIPEKRIIEKMPALLSNANVDIYGFHLFDFWKDGYYRNDSLWCAHNSYYYPLMRYQPNFHYKFNRKKQHSGRFPANVLERLPYCNYPLRVKHLGWLRDSDKKAKYERYMKLDPEGKYGSLAQYQSILDDAPSLEKFKE